MPYIADVIGSLRAKDLEILARLNTLRMDLYLLERRVSKLDGSPEPVAPQQDEVIQDETLF